MPRPEGFPLINLTQPSGSWTCGAGCAVGRRRNLFKGAPPGRGGTPERGARVRAMASYPAYLNYIDGRWCAAKGGKSFESRSPADNTVVGTAPLSSAGDVGAAAREA